MQAVAGLDEPERPIGVHRHVVPGRDGPRALGPGGRDVGVRTGEDDQGLAREVPALRVGPRHVPEQRPVRVGEGVEEQSPLQVRANAAHALARLHPLPAAAISPLIDCTADAHDGPRMNAAMAVKLAPADTVGEIMLHLVAGPNSRIRLIAASFLLAAGPGSAEAGAVLVEALRAPALRVRRAALVESLGTGGAAFLEGLKQRAGREGEAELRYAMARLIERLESRAEVEMQPVAAR